MTSYSTLQQFLPALRNLHANKPLTKQDLLTKSFLIDKEEDITMYYAPHNEFINKQAKVVIVGITPGWSQMKIAFESIIKSFAVGDTLETALKKTKFTACFAGSMRTNLLDMLDQCRIPEALGIDNSLSLFEEDRHLLHTTSVIKYPVFLKDKNYTGHHPPINHSSLLKHYAYKEFPTELTRISSSALIIPLGKMVEQVVIKLVEERNLPKQHCYLTGFPHPSGANGHRIKQFQQQKHQLREKVKIWTKEKR